MQTSTTLVSSRSKGAVFKTLTFSLLLCAGCALFPPRHSSHSGTTTSRAFLFDSGEAGGNAEIYAGRLLAECLLIAAVAGLILLLILSDETSG